MDYKVLGFNQESHHGGVGKWRKHQWRTVEGKLVPCRNGIHYCKPEHLVSWLGPAIWIFEDGSPEETIDNGDKMITRKGRIVERVETWNETTARLFAADCAEAVVHLVPTSYRDASVNAISAARAFARGELEETELNAASDAAWDAAWDAARAAASAAASAAAWDAARAAAPAAAWAAAWDAARAAASAAASAAAWAAAWDAAPAAARAAARDAARADQTVILFDYLEGRRS